MFKIKSADASLYKTNFFKVLQYKRAFLAFKKFYYKYCIKNYIDTKILMDFSLIRTNQTCSNLLKRGFKTFIFSLVIRRKSTSFVLIYFFPFLQCHLTFQPISPQLVEDQLFQGYQCHLQVVLAPKQVLTIPETGERRSRSPLRVQFPKWPSGPVRVVSFRPASKNKYPRFWKTISPSRWGDGRSLRRLSRTIPSKKPTIQYDLTAHMTTSFDVVRFT